MDYEIGNESSTRIKKMYQEYLSLDLSDRIEFLKLIEGDNRGPKKFLENFSCDDLEKIATLSDDID